MSALRTLLNGMSIAADQPALLCSDRGFQYGDGVFETMRLHGGQVRFIDDHWHRLTTGCQRLDLPLPDREAWMAQLSELCAGITDGVVKFTLTRGSAARGYRPGKGIATCLWQLFPPPDCVDDQPINLRWCQTRLSRNAQLAGIKHCNRLEQVLAQNEWHAPEIAEGLMMDTEGELVSATMSNVFLLIDQRWVTPDLRYCGIAGVTRTALLRWMQANDVSVEQRAVHADEVALADELFVCNAVRGIRPVAQLEARRFSITAASTLRRRWELS